MSNDELKKNYELFTDAWHLFRKWAILLPLNDEQWQQVMNDVEEIREKYNHDESVRYFMIGVITRLNEIEGRINQ